MRGVGVVVGVRRGFRITSVAMVTMEEADGGGGGEGEEGEERGVIQRGNTVITWMTAKTMKPHLLF
jgi:hypothetical protein